MQRIYQNFLLIVILALCGNEAFAQVDTFACFN